MLTENILNIEKNRMKLFLSTEKLESLDAMISGCGLILKIKYQIMFTTMLTTLSKIINLWWSTG